MDSNKVHASWNKLDWQKMPQNQGHCPLCNAKHNLINYKNKKYCTYNDIDNSGWDIKVYDILCNHLDEALNKLADCGAIVFRKLQKTVPMMIQKKQESIVIPESTHTVDMDDYSHPTTYTEIIDGFEFTVHPLRDIPSENNIDYEEEYDDEDDDDLFYGTLEVTETDHVDIQQNQNAIVEELRQLKEIELAKLHSQLKTQDYSRRICNLMD